MAFHPRDRGLVASGGTDGTVQLWDAGSGERIRTLHGHSKQVWGLAFSPDGQRLAAVGQKSDSMTVWDTKTWKAIDPQPQAAPYGLLTVAFGPDGRLDLLAVPWWTEANTLLLRNETVGGHWLDVRVEGANGVNRMGIGAKVRVYPAGKLGTATALLGSREIAIGDGWCSGQEAVAHFGLGSVDAVDLEVMLPHGKGKVVRRGLKVDQRLTVKP